MIAFQLAWFACVLGGAHHWPWLGVIVAVLVVALRLLQSPKPQTEAVMILAVGLIGAAWDSLLVRLGFLSYPSGMLLPWLAPIWIIAMWLAFATTLNVSLGWLKGRWYLASLFGAIGGPLAYYAGNRLGGVSFPDTLVAMTVLAGGWSFLMPLTAWIAERLDTRAWAVGADPRSSNLKGAS
nr:DUF2878 domain-containing protein [Thiocystis violacea]